MCEVVYIKYMEIYKVKVSLEVQVLSMTVIIGGHFPHPIIRVEKCKHMDGSLINKGRTEFL